MNNTFHLLFYPPALGPSESFYCFILKINGQRNVGWNHTPPESYLLKIYSNYTAMLQIMQKEEIYTFETFPKTPSQRALVDGENSGYATLGERTL